MWDGPTFQLYYLQLDRLIYEQLKKESPEYLAGVNDDEYLEYLVADAMWEPLEWYEDQKTIEQYTAKNADPRFRLRIPISSHPQLGEYLKFGPSTTRGSHPRWELEGDTLVIDTEATASAVERAIDDVRFWLGNRNKDIEAGNKTVRQKIQPTLDSVLAQVREKYGNASAELAKLNIPLHQSPTAQPKPIEIKPRQLTVTRPKPAANRNVEPSLSHDDVKGLVDFIDQYARTFEVTPAPYAKFEGSRSRLVLNKV